MVRNKTKTRARALQRVRAVLEAAQVPDAWLDAEVLLCHVLGTDRTALYANPAVPLTDELASRLDSLVARRVNREPLAYIRGKREFFLHSFLVTPAVLIPRPETETLLEYTLAWVYRRSTQAEPPSLVADIGTGSGCLAVSLAIALPDAHVFATDSSAAALEVARENSQLHVTGTRLTFLHGNLLAPLARPVDLIVANLPYVPDAEFPGLQPEVRDYEPSEALVPGGDGTRLNRLLLQQAPAKLRPGGALFLELHPSQAGTLKQEAEHCFPEGTVQILKDLAGLDRVLAVGLPPLPNLVCLTPTTPN